MILLLICLAILCTAAARPCSQCISLEDLRSPAYGIYFSAEGLHLATAYHNGSMAVVSEISGLQEHQSLFTQALDDALKGPKPRCERATCVPSYHDPPSDWVMLQSIFQSMLHYVYMNYLSGVVDLLRPITSLWPWRRPLGLAAPPPLHPTAEIMKQHLLALVESAPQDFRMRNKQVAIALPAYLAGSEIPCHIYTAVDPMFNRLSSPSYPVDAAFTASGYDMCPISNEHLPFHAPGQIMALEYDENRAIVMASWMQSPVRAYTCNAVGWDAFELHDRNNTASLSSWLDKRSRSTSRLSSQWR